MLTHRQFALLDDERLRSGLSLGELIRRAVDKTYAPAKRPTIRGFELSVGVWERPDAVVAGRRVRTRRARS